MTVYVDDMYLYPMGQFRGMKMSHMIADSLSELHRMADKIGVQRKWFQDKRSGPHYDIAISKRELAIANGAIPIELRTLSKMCFVQAVTGRLPKHYLAEIEWRRLQYQLLMATKRRQTELKCRARQSMKVYAYKARRRREMQRDLCGPAARFV